MKMPVREARANPAATLDQSDPVEAVEFARRNRIEPVALPAEGCAALLVPPTANGDPFDEMLVLHAQQLGARLLLRHPVAWRLA